MTNWPATQEPHGRNSSGGFRPLLAGLPPAPKAAKGKAAILVRNRSHLDAIVPALKDAGVRFRAVEIEQLGEKQVVQDLYALISRRCHRLDYSFLGISCGVPRSDFNDEYDRHEQVHFARTIQTTGRSLRQTDLQIGYT
jgi:hypothetical protein